MMVFLDEKNHLQVTSTSFFGNFFSILQKICALDFSFSSRNTRLEFLFLLSILPFGLLSMAGKPTD